MDISFAKKSPLPSDLLENSYGDLDNVVLPCCGVFFCFFFVFKAYSELWEMFENYIAGCVDGLFIISPAPPLL